MDSNRIEGSAKELGGKIQEVAGKALGDEETRADGVGLQIEGMGQDLYGQAKDSLRDMGDRAEQALDDAGDWTSQLIDEGGHQAHRATEAVSSSADKHPKRAILLALSVGFLAGVLFRRF